MTNWTLALGLFETPSQLLIVLGMVIAFLGAFLTKNNPVSYHDVRWSHIIMWSIPQKIMLLGIILFIISWLIL